MKITALKSQKQVETYFAEYYAAKSNTAYKLEWGGTLAKEMGLSGQVDKKVFVDLLEGSMNGQKLAKNKSRVAYDCDFSVDKSVSCLIAYTKDQRLRDELLAAFQDEVRKTMAEAEKLIGRQVGDAQNRHFQQTGTGIWASVLHPTNRLGEPHFHVHNVLLNITKDKNGNFRSLEKDAMTRFSGLAHERIRNRIESVLASHGISFSRGEKHEVIIDGLSDEFLDSKSQRKRQIDSYLRRNFGVDYEHASFEQREEATKRSRSSKKEESVENAFKRFENDSVGVEVVQQIKMASTPQKSINSPDVTQFVIEKHFERESVVTRNDLVKEILRKTKGQFTPSDVEKEVNRRIRQSSLVTSKKNELGQILITTKDRYEKESYIKDCVTNGKGKVSKVLKNREETARFLAKNPKFSEEQKVAAVKLLTTKDRIAAIQGVAGAGKTFLLKPVVETMQDKGFKVIGLGPSWASVHALGEAGTEGRTLQRFVMSSKAREGLEKGKTVIFLDESSLADTDSLYKLNRIAEKNQWRLVYIGDRKQLEAVSAGGLFSYMQNRQIIETAKIDESIRQKNAERHIRESINLLRSDPQKALKTLDEKGNVFETKNISELATEKYFSKNGNALIVTNSNTDRRLINEKIKEKLIQENKLEKSFSTKLFISKNLTEVEKSNLPTIYENKKLENDVIKFNRNYRQLGIKKDDVLPVEKIENGRVFVKKDDHLIDVTDCKKIDVGNLENKRIYENQKVMITGNANIEKGLKNKDVLTVKEINDNGKIILENKDGKKIELTKKEIMEIDDGYCLTVHSSQGLTAQNTIAVLKSNSDAKLGYVAMSRTKEGLEVLTDDKENLAKNLAFEQRKLTGLEAINERKMETKSNVKKEAEKEKELTKEKSQPEIRTIEDDIGIGIEF